jgi:cobalt-zinc-cadmium efflux system protein
MIVVAGKPTNEVAPNSMTDHHHLHNHGVKYGRAFAIGITLNVLFVVAEAYYGWQADSLALLSDAGHNLSDVLGLMVAWGGYFLGSLRPSRKHTYGLGRATMMAAMFNALLLLVVVGGIAWEAIDRFRQPMPIEGGVVMLVAAIGVAINGTTAWLFMSGNRHDLNIRGAYLHMAADALVSLGVVVTGALFIVTRWAWLDPAFSLVIALVILFGTWNLLRRSLHLSLDGVPASIKLDAVRSYLSALPEVDAVHDLHVWAMSTSETALTVHLVTCKGNPGDDFLHRVAAELRRNFAIHHTTIQIETDALICTMTSHA